MTTRREVYEQAGFPPICMGATSVLFVPFGRTIEDVLVECQTMGRLTDIDPDDDTQPGEWVVVTCDGGSDCWHLDIDVAPDFKWFWNDRQIWPLTRPCCNLGTGHPGKCMWT